ncbi:coiled-coil-helix-coiled-coil-helix domain-containing protein 7-like [Ptychodera flava]|uniref:coiled-coil-helix-coiled-coil-helix domain-containing protein 7-like n=1 Tax=Ptychodera flava TaxID=63121 RepID=UPI003969D5C3
MDSTSASATTTTAGSSTTGTHRKLNLPAHELNKKRTGPNTRAKRWTDEDTNPCHLEAEASFQCLHDTNFNREKCYIEFETYKNCKKFWNGIMKDRQRQGIKPYLPLAEQRESIRNGIDYNNVK